MSNLEKHAASPEELDKITGPIDLNKLPQVEVNPYSFRALHIKMKNATTNTVLADATGFLYQYDGTYWLITNYHNVTGVDMVTRERISNMAASPTAIEVPLMVRKNPPVWENAIFSLYQNESPLWYVHPIYGEKVDVVALPVSSNGRGYELKAMSDDYILTKDAIPKVADDVFILGYPYSKGSSSLPIWKRGSIAYEPELDVDDLPLLYVDTASRPGMSGSPVVYRRYGMNNMGIHDFNLIGIYSGRVNTETELDTQLGLVWKAQVIEEIIKGGVRDAVYYPHESFA